MDSIWYTSRWCYSVPLALLLIPIVLKKELAELAWMSILLFASLGLFVICNFIQLSFDKNFEPEGINTTILTPKIEWRTISALSVTMVAYSYQQNVFPIFSELQDKTTAGYAKVSLFGLSFTGFFYFTVGIIGCLMFGSSL